MTVTLGSLRYTGIATRSDAIDVGKLDELTCGSIDCV